ncbi:DEAD/DEAH box helicase [Nonomuraea rubra]
MAENYSGESADVWADPVSFGGNVVRQLLAPQEVARRSSPDNLELMTPEEVVASYSGVLSFDESGLRRAQLGALHCILGHWTTASTEPATVVMPTGTGKTETMLALLVAAKIPKLLVLVPSDHLRDQVANKFQQLGVLQRLGIVHPDAYRPVVGRMTKGMDHGDEAAQFAAACNVIVATPQVLQKCAEGVRTAILTACTHLFVDEAHHVEAPTWSYVRAWFTDRRVVQFTATPFREDGRHIAGKIVYSFPLREAQKDGYFAPINYVSVLDFAAPDRTLATKAVAQLRADLDAGLDHLLMARARSIPRAQELLTLYQQLAPDLNPVILNSRMGVRAKREALTAIKSRDALIIVCVNMLGEGFDLPALKIAAVHDPQKSLSVTLQFIGRFTRAQPGDQHLGDAWMFVSRPDSELDTRLRSLYAEDADWNVVVRNLSEAAVEAEVEVSEFELGFTSRPADLVLSNLQPKLSTVVYRAPTASWNPDALYNYFGSDILVTDPIGLNPQAGVAWCVVERHAPVRWSESRVLEETNYELYVLYFDQERRLLYINNSANDGIFEDLAEAVLGEGASGFTGSTVYRAFGDIVRLIPTNVGVLDVRNQFRRFSMHVGTDVSQGFPTAEARTKTQTHIAGTGYRRGERVSIAASAKGRVWSPDTASNVKYWRDWCDEIGPRLLDDSISIEDIIANFILPEPIQERPAAAVLSLEWPWNLYDLATETLHLEYDGRRYWILDADLRPDNSSTTGPVVFEVATDHWTVPYQLDIQGGKLFYQCLSSSELIVHGKNSSLPLSQWLNAIGLTVLFQGDQMLQPDGVLLRIDQDIEPYPRERLIALDWTGTDLKVESQREEKLPHSIQARAIRDLLSERHWDVVLDDDGSGEVADVVAMALSSDHLLVRLVHCKYARMGKAATQVKDLYEVCGQAMKSVRWRENPARLFQQLERRARKKYARTGVSPWEAGDLAALYRLRDRAKLLRYTFEIVIVQPGLSKAQATFEQLEQLAATELHVRHTADASLTIHCSA